MSANLEQMEYEEPDREVPTTHSHWSPYDMSLEGARWQKLHAALSTEPIDLDITLEITKQLEQLSHSYGYGQADSYLTDTDGMSDEDIDADPNHSYQRSVIFDDYPDSDYFENVSRSLDAMRKDLKTDVAHGMLSVTRMKICAAFEEGRDLRVIEASPSQTSTGP